MSSALREGEKVVFFDIRSNFSQLRLDNHEKYKMEIILFVHSRENEVISKTFFSTAGEIKIDIYSNFKLYPYIKTTCCT